LAVQLTLTGIFESAPIERPAARSVDLAALENYALLYTATETGNKSGIRFMMTLDDARRWCSSPDSAGTMYGTSWAYFYTTVARFLNRDMSYEVELDELDLRGQIDNGQWDERIAAAGCVKIALAEIPSVLEPLGVTVLVD